MLHDRDGRITGFQEKPAPEEALSDLGNCGIYMFDPQIFDYFPARPFVDWAQDVFPVLLENDVPFHIHEMREYWNDVGSLSELRQGTFDALRGELRLQIEGEEVSPGVIVAADRRTPSRRCAAGHRDRRAGVDRARRADRRGRAPDGAGRARRRRARRRRARSCARASSSPAPRSPPSRS